jgi:hypothetical protein
MPVGLILNGTKSELVLGWKREKDFSRRIRMTPAIEKALREYCDHVRLSRRPEILMQVYAVEKRGEPALLV